MEIRARICDAAINVGTLFLLLVPPYLFGAVTPWPRMLVQVVAVAVFLAWLWRPRPGKAFLQGSRVVSPRLVKLAVTALLLFAGYVLLQSCPLPGVVTRVLSPHAAGVRGAEAAGAAPLSVAPNRTLADARLLLCCVGLFAVIAFPTEGQMSRWRLGAVAVGNGVLLSLLAVGQEVVPSGGKIYWMVPCVRRPFGPFANPSDFAGYVLMLVPLALAVGIARGRAGNRDRWLVLGVGAAAAMSVAILLSASRSAVIVLMTGVLIGHGVIALRLKERRLRLGVYASALLLCLLGAWTLRAGFVEKVEETGSAWRLRTTIWREALGLLHDYPVTGTGFGTFEVVFPQERKTLTQQLCFTNAENDVLELLIETGAIGTVLMGAFLLAWGIDAARGARMLRGGYRAPLIWGGGIGCAAALLHSLFHFSLHIPANALLFAVCLGFMHAEPRGRVSGGVRGQGG